MDTRTLTSRFRRHPDRAPAPAERPAEPGPAPAPAFVLPEASLAFAGASTTLPDDPKPAESEDAKPASAPPLSAPPSRLIEGSRPKGADRVAAAGLAARFGAARKAAGAAALPAAAAAGIALAIGIGYAAGLSGHGPGGVAALTARMAETSSDLRHSGQEIARLAAELKAMKGTVEALKSDRDKSRGEILAKQSQLSEKLEKAGQDQAARLGRLAEQVERVEKGQRDPARYGAVTERLDRIERSITVAPAPAPTPPPKPSAAAPATASPAPEVTQTGSIADAKPAAKPDAESRNVKIEGYFVRDIDGSYALIETKSGRYIDVAVGHSLPGLGRVEAIERRGRQWVVVTAKGFIGER